MAVDLPDPLSPINSDHPPFASRVCASPWNVPQFQSSSRSSRKPAAMDTRSAAIISRSCLGVARQALLHPFELRWTKSRLENSHHFILLGLGRSECAEEVELLEASYRRIDRPHIADLIVG